MVLCVYTGIAAASRHGEPEGIQALSHCRAKFHALLAKLEALDCASDFSLGNLVQPLPPATAATAATATRGVHSSGQDGGGGVGGGGGVSSLRVRFHIIGNARI